MEWNGSDRAAATTMGELASWAAARFTDRVYLRPHEPRAGSITYTGVEQVARGCAAFLDERGVAPGARVAIVMHNSSLTALLFLSVIAAGRVLVPVNPKSSAAEAHHILTATAPALILADPAEAPLVAGASADVALVENEAFVAELLDRGRSDRGAHVPVAAGPESDAEIVFTSGSTGRPKGVVLSHRALLSNAFALGRLFRFTGAESFLTACPLFHNSGQLFTTLTPLWCGAVTTPVRSEVAMLRFWSIIEQFDITWTLVVNAYLAMLARNAPTDHAHRTPLRGVLAGGSRLPAELIERFESSFGVPVHQVYGLTETTSIATCEPPTGERRTVGSAGRPLSIGSIRIVDPAGADVAAGERGEISFQGENLFSRYLDQPEFTADRLREGWLRTGDIGRLDADGNLHVLERVDNMLIVGGENVYPSEVEGLLPKLVGASDVLLVGVPDPIMGVELVLVYEVLAGSGAEADEEAWREVLAAHLSTFKIPRRMLPITALGLPAFPRAANGKVLRAQVTAAAAGELAAVQR